MSARKKKRPAPAVPGPSQASNQTAWLRHPAFISILLALGVMAIYLPVTQNAFVDYDDGDYVTANTQVQGGLTWANVRLAFVTGHASNWHPLTWLSHMADRQFFGLHAGAHHWINVLFHSANTVLLFLLLRRMTGSLGRSALVAALFALHPLHVESVAWVSERKDVLSAFFFLLTLLGYERYVDQSNVAETAGVSPISSPAHEARNTEHRRRSTLFYALTLLCFALGLMSKPMLVTVPFLLLLLDYWPLRRFELNTENWKLKTFLLVEKIPFFLLSLASSVITFLVQRKGGAVSTSISLGARVANALVSYARYLGKLFWPENLSVLYPHPGHWPAMYVIGSGALVLAIFTATIAFGRRRPYLIVGWLWFFGSMVPVIGLIQVGIQSMADRYMYLPIIGLFVMLVWGLAETAERPSPSRASSNISQATSLREPMLALASVTSLLLCACLTWRQLQYWRTSETLFRRATQVTRNNYLAYNNLGFYLSGKGRPAEAIENYRMALKIQPAYEDAHNNLGHALAGQGKYAEAIAEYSAALRTKPLHVEVHNNLGNALAETGHADAAIEHYRIALQQQPSHADAHNNLGIALAMQGKLEEAIPHFQQAIRFKPKYASAHSNLGNALAAQHRLDDAMKEYQESLRLNPDDAQAHNNLGNVLAEQGKLPEAIAHYSEALRLKADNPEAHFNLGIALARQGKRQEAFLHYQEALRLRPDYPQAKSQLDALMAPAQH